MALPTVGSTAPCVLSATSRHVERLEEAATRPGQHALVGVEVRELRVGTEATAGLVDCRDLLAQNVLRLVGTDRSCTTTVAVVPMARKVRAMTQGCGADRVVGLITGTCRQT